MIFLLIALILVIEIVFKGIISRHFSTSTTGRIGGVIFTLLIATAFTWFASDSGVFNKERNYFEILGVSPTASNTVVVDKINQASPEILELIPKHVEFMQKRFRDEYSKFGEITEASGNHEYDTRMSHYLPYYFIYLMIAMVF